MIYSQFKVSIFFVFLFYRYTSLNPTAFKFLPIDDKQIITQRKEMKEKEKAKNYFSF